MKMNTVVKVNMKDRKSRSKAFKIASGILGVESVSLKGDDNNKIEIIGDDMVDPLELTRMLRRGLGHAEVVSVGPVAPRGKKNEEGPKTHAGEPKPDEILCLEMEMEMEMGKQELQERGLKSELESESESESESPNAHFLETNLQESHEYEKEEEPKTHARETKPDESLCLEMEMEMGKQELQERGIPISEVPSKKSEFIFHIINILLELLSVVFDHLSSVYKHRYALLAMVTSFVAAIICIMELSYKAGKERVVLRWKSKLPWYYHSSSNHRRFGTVLEMTGLIFAILQTISSTVAYILYLTHVKYTFNLSLLPLVLAMSLFCSKFMQESNSEEPSKIFDNTELTEIHVKTS